MAITIAAAIAPERLYSTELISQRALLYGTLPSPVGELSTETLVILAALIVAGIIILR